MTLIQSRHGFKLSCPHPVSVLAFLIGVGINPREHLLPGLFVFGKFSLSWMTILNTPVLPRQTSSSALALPACCSLRLLRLALHMLSSELEQQFEDSLNAEFGGLSLRFLSLQYFAPQIPFPLESLNSLSSELWGCCFLFGHFSPSPQFGKCPREHSEVNMEHTSVLGSPVPFKDYLCLFPTFKVIFGRLSSTYDTLLSSGPQVFFPWLLISTNFKKSFECFLFFNMYSIIV